MDFVAAIRELAIMFAAGATIGCLVGWLVWRKS